MANHQSLVAFVLMVMHFISGDAQIELLVNPDFEDSSNLDVWKTTKFKLEQSNDSLSGNYSAKITERKEKGVGIQQTVTVKANTRYVFQGYIKLENHKQGFMYHKVEVVMKSTFSYGNSTFDKVCIQKFVQKEHGWTELGGDFTTRAAVTKVIIKIQIAEKEVNYVFDKASFKELLDIDWETKANQFIERNRKGNLTIRLTNFTESADKLDGMTVEVKMLRNAFPFGALVNTFFIVDPAYANYSKFFFDNFEWATIGNTLKWKQTEKKQGELTFETAAKAVEEIRKHGLPIRGHNIFWGFAKNTPTWVAELPVENLTDVMKKRVTDVKENIRINRWVVSNEALHGDFYQQKLKNPNITMEMHHWMKDADPNYKLYLNDFNIVNAGTFTTGYKNQGELFKANGVPLDGVGIQSHFKDGNIDMTTLRYRVDTLARAGIPIWISELSINEPNVTLRAQAMKNVLTLYFGHPKVSGIINFGFWNGSIRLQDESLATGPDIELNEAGKAYIELRRSWRTNDCFELKQLNSSEKVIRAFKGKYRIMVYDGGNVTYQKEIWMRQKTAEVEIPWSKIKTK